VAAAGAGALVPVDGVAVVAAVAAAAGGGVAGALAVVAAGAVLEDAGAGAAEAAGFALAEVAAEAAGFALAEAAGFALAEVAAGAFAVLDADCANTVGAIETNPANAVNHKALLRRITTLSGLRIAEDLRAAPAPRNDETKRSPKLQRGIFL